MADAFVFRHDTVLLSLVANLGLRVGEQAVAVLTVEKVEDRPTVIDCFNAQLVLESRRGFRTGRSFPRTVQCVGFEQLDVFLDGELGVFSVDVTLYVEQEMLVVSLEDRYSIVFGHVTSYELCEAAERSGHPDHVEVRT